MKYGLDFGTTNSAISIDRAEGSLESPKSTLLPIDTAAPDPNVIRTALYFYPRKLVIDPHTPKENIATNNFRQGEIWYEGEFRSEIGSAAVNQYLKDNRNRTPGVTRHIYSGKWIDLGGGVQVPENYAETDYGTGRLLYALKTGLKSPLYKGTGIFGKFFSLEEQIANFIKVVAQRGNSQTGETITEITCGRPVEFSPNALKDKAAEDRLRAGLKEAGFKKIDFEYEPIAAAKHYLSLHPGTNKKVFVFDFGGGTLDTTIVQSGSKAKILATGGVYIGGNLLNSDILRAKLFPYFGSDMLYGDSQLNLPSRIFLALENWYSIPLLNDPEEMRLLRNAHFQSTDPEALDRLIYLVQSNLGFELYEAIEIAKKELSTYNESVISFKDGPIDIALPITRKEFETIIDPRAKSVEELVDKTLKDAKVDPEEIDVVVRTGGSSLIPLFENMLAKKFGSQKLTLLDTFTSIASGLSLPKI